MDLTIITIAICALCVVIALWGWINFQLKSSAIFTDLKNANGTLNRHEPEALCRHIRV